MSKELVACISEYVEKIICGFESRLYWDVEKVSPEKIKYLSSNYEHFISILRDDHENYYTSVFNSLISGDNPIVKETFGQIQKFGQHSNRCILNIVGNLAVSVHFNIDRKKLNHRNHDLYITSVKQQIHTLLYKVNISKLFDHICPVLYDRYEKLIPEGEKFLTISIFHDSNGTKKMINSFSNKN